MRMKMVGAGLFFVLAGCSGGDNGTEPEPTPETGAISGTVVEGSAGVPGAAIALSGGGGTATTNANGEFSFSNVEVGSYTLTVTLPEGFTLADGESASKSVTVTADQTATVSWGAIADDPPAQQNAAVTLTASSFDPSSVTITVGSTVQWTNGTATAHTITPNNSSQTGAWADESISGDGATFSHTFDTTGEYDYHCSIHAGMTGEIIVQ